MSRIVLVTGAAAGIGLATAQAFAAAGDLVAVADIDAAAAAATATGLGPSHLGVGVDVADEAMVEAAVEEVLARFGRIDVLVNNAGIVDPGARPALDVPLATVNRLINVNLAGSFAVARAAARAMIETGGGSVVNIASGAALSALPGRAAYGMTKAAILGLTRTLARDWAGAGVRVNAVLPGYVETEILRSLRREGRFDPAAVARAIPLGRMAEPGEIAAVVRHAASMGGTGGSLLVDGGVDAFGGSGAASTGLAPAAPAGGCAVVLGGASGPGAALADQWRAEGFVTTVIDPADSDALAAALAAVEGRDGPIGRAAIAVGPFGPTGPLATHDVAGFARTTSASLITALVSSRATAVGMIRRGGGAIVHLLPPEGDSDVVATGASLLTKALACEWAAHGVRVNAISCEPSSVGDAAGTASFLVSDAASYVTGAIWPG